MGPEMYFLTLRRFALVALATVGLLVFAVMLLRGSGGSGPVGVAVIGPVGSVVMSAFATSCAAGAAWAARGGQRLAWTVMTIGLAGWTAADAVWWYVDLGGVAPISNRSVADLGYVVLPLFALVAALVVPSRDDSGFGIGLLLDGINIAASLLMVLAIVTLGHAGRTVSFPRILLITVTAVYLGIVAMAFIVARKAEPGRKLSPGLLTVGLAVIAAAGVIRVCVNRHDQIAGNVVILGWVGGIYLLALSAIASRPGPDLDTRLPERPSKLSIWLPNVPLWTALVVGGVYLWPVYRDDAFVFSIGLVVVASGLIRHLVMLNRRERLLAAVSDAALRDAVTGLANQRLFDEQLARAVQRYVRHAVPISVMTVSVVDFTMVNDTLGYPVGDELLRSVGERIRANLRAGDTVARMGGDEFAILLEDRSEVAAELAWRFAKSFDEPLEIKGHRLNVHLSIGVASTPLHPGATLTPAGLLLQADAARHSAQQASSTDVRIFTPDMDAPLGSHLANRDGIARLQLLGELRHAIDDGLLTLLYQPKFSMLTGSVCGAEALVRWHHPELGALGPGEFLPLVREHGLMDALTNFVLSRAVADASKWYAAEAAIPVAINVWAPSLDEDALPDHIMSVLDAHAMPASSLTIEITEDLLVADLSKARTVLNRLRKAGIRVAIDDFGSGYATLTYLRELPMDDVKLDRQFIAPILHDERAAMITRAIIELARAFGIACVAEGVEDWETAQRLKEYGCDVVQGNFCCGPVPASEIPHVATNLTLTRQ
jgi:diguanylate cyclase